MFKIIPNKKEIGAEIICDIKNISNKDLKKNEICTPKIWDVVF